MVLIKLYRITRVYKIYDCMVLIKLYRITRVYKIYDCMVLAKLHKKACCKSKHGLQKSSKHGLLKYYYKNISIDFLIFSRQLL